MEVQSFVPKKKNIYKSEETYWNLILEKSKKITTTGGTTKCIKYSWGKTYSAKEKIEIYKWNKTLVFEKQNCIPTNKKKDSREHKSHYNWGKN
jgi:hypothetical protein